jgi:CheY-like chemotaxis protein
VDGLTDLIKFYKLDMKVAQLVNLVAEAIVFEPKKVAVEVPAPAALPLEGFRILVVDDEVDTLAYLAAVFADNGAATLEAQSGDEALEIIRREKPDLVTLDLSMPGRDGGEVFEAIRSDPAIASTRVCIITGRPELRRLIYDRDVRPPEGYINKPVDEKSLLLDVRKILETETARREA